VTAKPAQPRLLADENTSHRLISSCGRLVDGFPIVHLAAWQGGSWLGLDDTALLLACAEVGLILVAFDRATLPRHAGQLIRAGHELTGLILFRRTVRSTDYGRQAHLVTEFWLDDGQTWDWRNRIVYLPKSP
jgi:hypothetical protein